MRYPRTYLRMNSAGVRNRVQRAPGEYTSGDRQYIAVITIYLQRDTGTQVLSYPDYCLIVTAIHHHYNAKG